MRLDNVKEQRSETDYVTKRWVSVDEQVSKLIVFGTELRKEDKRVVQAATSCAVRRNFMTIARFLAIFVAIRLALDASLPVSYDGSDIEELLLVD